MEDNEQFRTDVLSEQIYYKFPRELDYYTGLTRNDKNTLELIYKRFQTAFNNLALELNLPNGIEDIFAQINVDKFFTNILKNQNNHKPIIQDVDTNKIKNTRPTEEAILQFYDNKLSKMSDDSIRQKIDDFNLEKLIIIMCNVLRNSEGVEDYKLKREIYFSLIKNTVAWLILYKETLVRYVIQHNTLPPNFQHESNLVRFFQFLPYSIQCGLNNHLGTNKLTTIIAEKITKDMSDKNCSDIERYFSVGLYWDNNGKEKDKPFKQLISKLSNNIVQDYCLFKLLDYFYRKTSPESDEEKNIIELLSRLKLKHEKLPKRLKGQIMLALKSDKKKYGLKK
jgi:hypothetical protein